MALQAGACAKVAWTQDAADLEASFRFSYFTESTGHLSVQKRAILSWWDGAGTRNLYMKITFCGSCVRSA
jgi:hypothetical protein